MSTAEQAKTWADDPMSPFDIESTGVDTETARIVTASVVTIVGSTPRVRSWLVDPGVDIPAEATAVHGITTEHARSHGVKASYAVAEIREALSDALYEGRGRRSLDELQAFQREAHARWAANFQAHLRSQGKPGVISPHWPIVPFAPTGAAA